MGAFLRALASVVRPLAGALGAVLDYLLNNLRDPATPVTKKLLLVLISAFCLALLALGAMQL